MLVRLSFFTLVFLVIFNQTFWLFKPPSKKNSEINDISFESPKIELLESEIKKGCSIIKGVAKPI